MHNLFPDDYSLINEIKGEFSIYFTGQFYRLFYSNISILIYFRRIFVIIFSSDIAIWDSNGSSNTTTTSSNSNSSSSTTTNNSSSNSSNNSSNEWTGALISMATRL